MTGKIVTLFAGYGGADLGIKQATQRGADFAINHWPLALAVHRANHPTTRHLVGDVWHYAPRDVVGLEAPWMVWASPTCVHFSKAKGGPLDRNEASKTRALAWVAARWVRDARPEFLFLENVPAFRDWGPLQNDGTPDQKRKGQTFRRWRKAITDAGYSFDARVLKACDFGAPTSRERLFVVARRDSLPVVWPTPSHGPGTSKPHRGAHEIIDWSVPAPSIFGRPKPLVDATCERIARGVRRFVLETAQPFIIPASHGGDVRVHDLGDPLRTVTAASRSPFQLVVPYLVHLSNGEREGQAPRIYDIRQPLNTVVASGVKQGLCFAFLMKNFGGGYKGPGLDLRQPLSTVTAVDHHALVICSTIGDKREQVRDFLRRYRGQAKTQRQTSLFELANDDATVTIGGESYVIADIGMRLLTPRELARSHDFGDDLALEFDADGNAVSKTAQIRLIGNSVPIAPAAALVAANVNAYAQRGAA